MIGLIVASHLVVVGPAKAEKKHPFKCAPVSWMSKSSSWDARKYHRYIREYQETFVNEDVISSMFGYFNLDELIPVSKSDKKVDLVIIVIVGEDEETKSRTVPSSKRGTCR
jgi:hypothetical protein